MGEKPAVQPQTQRIYSEEDQVDLSIVLHGGNVDDEVDSVDPPVGRVKDQGPECRILSHEIELNRDQRYDEDEVDEGHHHQGDVHSLCYNLGKNGSSVGLTSCQSPVLWPPTSCFEQRGTAQG